MYRSPKTAFVAKFVGDNNALEGEMLKKEGEMVLVSAYGHEFWVRAGSYRLGKKISVFIRPESFLLEPEENLSKVNRLKVKIKDILFDGANSKLLCLLPAGPEIMVALPQNKKFAHLKPGDDLNIGWFYEDSLAFS